MSKMLKRMCVTAVMLTLFMTLCTAASYAGYAEEVWQYHEKGNMSAKPTYVKVAGQDVIAGGGGQGYEYEPATNSLFLNGCSLEVTSPSTEFIKADGTLNVYISGINVFKAKFDNTGGEEFAAVFAAGSLSIYGDGSLTVDLSETQGPASGFRGTYDVTIGDSSYGPKLNIIGGDKGLGRYGSFHGIRLNPYVNYEEHSGSEGHFGILIQNAEIEISNSVSNASPTGSFPNYKNIGIAAEDGDLYIKNSYIKVNTSGGNSQGIGAGYYLEGMDSAYYGGELLIDETSRVEIMTKNNAAHTNALYFYHDTGSYYDHLGEDEDDTKNPYQNENGTYDEIKPKYIYVGDHGVEWDSPFSWAQWTGDDTFKSPSYYTDVFMGPNVSMGWQLECEHEALIISPTALDINSLPDPDNKDSGSGDSDSGSDSGSESGDSDSGSDSGTGHKTGDTVNVSSGTLLISSSNAKSLSFIRAKNKKKVTVPETVVIDGVTYYVVEIGPEAFKGSKIKTVVVGRQIHLIKKEAFINSKVKNIILKTKKLAKKTVKGCFKKSKVKSVIVKVGSKKINKTYVKKYKKIFTKKNSGKKVTVK